MGALEVRQLLHRVAAPVDWELEVGAIQLVRARPRRARSRSRTREIFRSGI